MKIIDFNHSAFTATEKESLTTRGVKKNKPQTKNDNTLLKSIKRSVLLKSEFCEISDNRLTISNGIAILSQQIEEDFCAYPKIKELKAVLEKCSSEFAISVYSENALSVVSGKFRGVVDCNTNEYETSLPDIDQNPQEPDTASLQVSGGQFYDALATVVQAATCAASQPISFCVFIGPETIIATNGFIEIEAAHGLNFPCVVVLPAESVKLLLRLKLDLIGIGGSNNSLTFHFENNTWFKCYLTNFAFSNKAYEFLNNARSNCVYSYDLTNEIYKAIEIIGSTGKQNKVIFSKNGVMASEKKGNSSSYDLELCEDIFGFSYDSLKVLKKLIGSHFGFGYGADGEATYLYFEKRTDEGVLLVRGIIMGIPLEKPSETEQHLDDEVPF